MHNGAYKSLERAVRHHFAPEEVHAAFEPSDLPGFIRARVEGLSDEKGREKLADDIDSELPTSVDLDKSEFEALMAFLHSLTSPSAKKLESIRPKSVPSRLPMR
jgi:hypothetical protein